MKEFKKSQQGNYEIAKIKARPYFLEKDQAKMIQKYQLDHDESYLYLEFLYEKYRIQRSTAAVEKSTEDNTWADSSHEEVLSIYDLLGYADNKPTPTGKWCVVNSLPGVAQTSGLGNTFFKKYEDIFASNEETFIKACQKLGGQQVDCGDIGFQFRIFDNLEIRMKMYRADDEFDAQITLLWDYNTLNFVHYETTYYIADVLFEKIIHFL